MASGHRKQRITVAFDALCRAIADALGAAQGRRDAAVLGHAEAMAETWLRDEGLDAARADPGLRRLLANKKLFRAVGRVEADRHAAFTPWLDHGPARLGELLLEAAPESAGDPTDRWLKELVTKEWADEDRPVPELWYLGRGRIGNRPAEGFPVAVPLLDESHLQISSTPDGREAAEALVQSLLLRVTGYFRPGQVRLHVWDVGSFTGTLPGLYPLTRNGLLTVHDPTRLPQLLEELSDGIRRVHTRVLVEGHPSLRAMAADPEHQGKRTEPWVIAVLIGNRSALREDDHRQLQRVARGGLACGIQLVLLDVPVTLNAAVETVQLGDDPQAHTSMTGPFVRVELERAPDTRQVTDAAHAIAAGYDDWCSRITAFTDLLPKNDADWGTASSREGLVAPVGFNEGEKHDIRLEDVSPHALIGGPSGSGKTNLLLTMIGSLAARYGPEELALYLLDFKEGVSFAQFAPWPGRDTWLPQAKLVGININTDREFGLALLQFLSDQMRSRAAEAKAVGVSKLEELRRWEDSRPADERRSWPRIVAVIDEFQYLFAETDAVTKAAAVLLEDVARRGRSQGIHLVLASQDISSIQVFWGRPAVFEQFVLRIALPRARRVLVETNDAAVGLPRWHAVINHESGTKHGNRPVRIPDASTQGPVQEVQQRLYRKYEHTDGVSKPHLFDGSRAPEIGELVAALPTDPHAPPRAVLGQCIDVHGRPAAVRLSATPGRNIGVLASVGKDAVPMLTAAAVSLAGQPWATPPRVVIAPLVVEAKRSGEWLARKFQKQGAEAELVGLGELAGTIETLAAELTDRLSGKEDRPTLIVLYAADAATDTVLDRTGTENLRKLLRFGPETGVHVLGWWRSIQRLRALLTMGATVDDLGAWVALDVHGAELGPLAPGMMVSWAPRAGRGLFFDRAQHAAPEVIIVPSVDPRPKPGGTP